MAQVEGTRIVVPCVLSFPFLFEPQKPKETDAKDKKPSYSVGLVLLTPQAVQKVQGALMKAGEAALPGKDIAKMVRENDLKFALSTDPLKIAKKRYDAVKALGFANARSQFQPDVVDHTVAKVLDRKEVYAGRHANVSVTAYFFNHPVGGKGLSLALNSVQILQHGERLDNRVAPEDEFTVDGTVNLEDLGA